MLRIRSERSTGLNFFSGLPKYTGHCVAQVPHLAHISIYSLRTLGPPSIAVIAPITSSAILSVMLSGILLDGLDWAGVFGGGTVGPAAGLSSTATPTDAIALLFVILSPLYQGLGKENTSKVKDLRKRNEQDEHLGQCEMEQKHIICR